MLHNSNSINSLMFLTTKHKSALENVAYLNLVEVNAANGYFYMHVIFNRLTFHNYI